MKNKPLKFRMIRETIYFYQGQIERLDELCRVSGRKKSEIIRCALEAFLRYEGLTDPDFQIYAGESENTKVPVYKENLMEPFVKFLEREV